MPRLFQLPKLAAIVGAASALALSSCALPLDDAWRMARNEGVISYGAYEVGTRVPRRYAIPQNAPSAPYGVGGIGRTRYAPWVYGLPGYVRSPYTYPPRYVDVGATPPGTVMVCPYSKKTFVIPPYPVYVSWEHQVGDASPSPRRGGYGEK